MLASVAITTHGFAAAPRKMCVFGLKRGKSSEESLRVMCGCAAGVHKPERRVVRCMVS